MLSPCITNLFFFVVIIYIWRCYLFLRDWIFEDLVALIRLRGDGGDFTTVSLVFLWRVRNGMCSGVNMNFTRTDTWHKTYSHQRILEKDSLCGFARSKLASIIGIWSIKFTEN